MKRNLTLGILFIGAIALSSCSTQNKIASVKTEDDVYFTKAKAGDEPVYAAANTDTYRHDNYSSADRSADYYYYDSYESRLNRFYGYSPYGSSYYSNAFYGYSPFSPYTTGITLGLGLGYGAYNYYGYSPYSYGFGYNPYYGYSPYGSYGGYGYGGGSYWGPYSYYNTVPGVVVGNNNTRAYRGSGLPGTSVGSGTTGYTGYGSAGSYPPANRPVRSSTSNPNNGGSQTVSRPVRQAPQQTSQPQYQPPQQQYTPPPSSNNSGSSSSSGSSSGSSSSGSSSSSGTGRAVRP